MTVTERLAQFVVNTTYENFSPDVVKTAKRLLLDGLGAMVLGPTEPVSQKVIKHVKEMGGAPNVGIPGASFKTSLTNAMLVNGVTGHAIEHEAVGRFTASSPMALTAAPFAVAENFGLSGKSVLEGFILGYEVQGKLGLGCAGSANKGWTGVFFPLGVAACASKMMGLSVDQTRAALGLAADSAGGTLRHCGYMAHFIGMAGFPGRHGMTAALLAKEGVTADPDIIDGARGYGEWLGEFDPDKITKQLGNPFYLVSPGNSIKKYNCCFGMHPALDALWELISQYDIRNEDVESVQVTVPAYVTTLIHYPEPQNGEQAKFSFEHAFAVLLVERLPDQVTNPRSFSDEGAFDPRYVEARKKVKVVVTEQPGGRTLVGKEMPVTILMRDGRSFSKEAPVLKGSVDLPLSDEELTAIYKGHVRTFLSPEQVQRSIDLIWNLEKLSNVSELMQIATFGHAGSSTDN